MNIFKTILIIGKLIKIRVNENLLYLLLNKKTFIKNRLPGIYNKASETFGSKQLETFLNDTRKVKHGTN